MTALIRRVCVLASAVFASSSAWAGSLQVSPVLLEVPAPGAATVLTLKNTSPRVLNAQVRVFRWRQEGGQDRFEPASDVVASPPMVRMTPGTDYTVRVVRTARTPIAAEESYRVVVDELPDPERARTGAVSFLLRHSIPVFFMPPEGGRHRLAWSVETLEGRPHLVARNDGQRRARLSGLRVGASQSSHVISDGLAGYVLPGSFMKWPLRGPALQARTVSVSAMSDTGQINAVAQR